MTRKDGDEYIKDSWKCVKIIAVLALFFVTLIVLKIHRWFLDKLLPPSKGKVKQDTDSGTEGFVCIL